MEKEGGPYNTVAGKWVEKALKLKKSQRLHDKIDELEREAQYHHKKDNKESYVKAMAELGTIKSIYDRSEKVASELYSLIERNDLLTTACQTVDELLKKEKISRKLELRMISRPLSTHVGQELLIMYGSVPLVGVVVNLNNEVEVVGIPSPKKITLKQEAAISGFDILIEEEEGD